MARRSKAEITAEKVIDAAVGKHMNGRQYNVMDLGKIAKAGYDAYKAGKDIDEAVKAACDTYAKGC
jgi:hypothetical protein